MFEKCAFGSEISPVIIPAAQDGQGTIPDGGSSGCAEKGKQDPARLQATWRGNQAVTNGQDPATWRYPPSSASTGSMTSAFNRSAPDGYSKSTYPRVVWGEASDLLRSLSLVGNVGGDVEGIFANAAEKR